MSLHGKANPNSNSSWGNPVEIESGMEWKDAQFATEAAIDEAGYEPLEPGHERFYLVAVKWGRWTCNGPAPDQARACALWVTGDGRHGIERVYPAVRSGHDWYIDDGYEVPDAISRNLEDAGDVPDDSAANWREVVRDAHRVSSMSTSDNTQTDLTDFQTAAEISEETSDERPNWEPRDESETDTGTSVRCQGCGKVVTKKFAQVFGDNNDEITRCPHCSTYREMKYTPESGVGQ